MEYRIEKGSADLSPPKRRILQIGGYGFFAIGLVGIVVPVLPTTVFWIVAAALFAKSSPAMYRRILSWPGVGSAIADFMEQGAITRRGKIIAILGMTMGAALILLLSIPVLVKVAGVLAIFGSALYVAGRPEPAAVPVRAQ